jgi:hypothetical protein
MTVVVGSVLPGRAVLLADCRATITRPWRPRLEVDKLLKVLPIGPRAAIAFAGNVSAAGQLLLSADKVLSRDLSGRSRLVVPLTSFLPRHFRHAFSQLQPTARQGGVTFVVASCFSQFLEMIVSRSRAVELAMRTFRGEGPIRRNWIPDIAVRIMQTPAASENVGLRGYPRVVMYVMHSPEFEPQFVAPLHSVAIGSGEDVSAEFEAAADWIHFGAEGGQQQAEEVRRMAMMFFGERPNTQGVGGLFPCLIVDGNGVRGSSFSVRIPIDAPRIEMVCRGPFDWIQIDHGSGQVAQLTLPWQFNPSAYSDNQRFDAYRVAQQTYMGGPVI